MNINTEIKDIRDQVADITTRLDEIVARQTAGQPSPFDKWWGKYGGQLGGEKFRNVAYLAWAASREIQP